MDPNSTNYNSSATKDDGSCTYKGQVVYWWQQPFRDSCIAHGVASVNVYFDNTFVGSMAVSSQFWTGTPACGGTGALTITKDLGKNSSGSFGNYYKVLDGSANVLGTTTPVQYSITGNGCKAIEITW